MKTKIRKRYKEILHQIEAICDEVDLTQSDNLLKIFKMTKLRDKFNCIDFFDNFKPNIDKPYSILNTYIIYINNNEIFLYKFILFYMILYDL